MAWWHGLVLVMFLPTVAATCEAEDPDAAGDTNPQVLPPHYDLLNIHLASDGANLTWTWQAGSLAGATSVHYWGQIDLEGSGVTYHPSCRFPTAAVSGPGIDCELVRAPAENRGGAVAFERVQGLESSVAGNNLSVVFPLAVVDLRPGDHLPRFTALTQVNADARYLVGATSLTPQVTDITPGSDWAICPASADAEESSEAVPTAPPQASNPAPAFPFALGVLAVLACAIGRRR